MRARTQFDQHVKSGAFVDAVMTLLVLEMPAWTLRRIVREDGLWLCSLSRHPDLPVELDDTAEAFHRDLPLAMLGAFVEARRATTSHIIAVTTPKLPQEGQHAVCCENFT